MPRVDITRIVAPGTRGAAGLALTWLTGDATNQHRIKSTGKELLLARNTSGASARTVTVDSTADPWGREKDITAYSIPIGGFAVFGPWDMDGWVDSSGYINVDVSHAEVHLAVIVLP